MTNLVAFINPKAFFLCTLFSFFNWWHAGI